MAEGLAAPVARRLHAVLARPQQVVEVGGEPPVLDHRRPARGRALVVDALAAPGVLAAAVVVGGHERLGELLAEPAGVHARVLLDGVGLEAVADRLVEQHAAEAVAHHHRQAAGGRVHGVQQRERAARGPVRHRLGILLEQLPAGVAAARVAAGLHAPVATRHDLGAEAHAGAVVRGGAAVRSEDLDLAARLGVSDPRLRDLGPGGARALVAGAQEVRLAGGLHVVGADRARGAASRAAAALSAAGWRASPRTASETDPATRSRSSSARPST